MKATRRLRKGLSFDFKEIPTLIVIHTNLDIPLIQIRSAVPNFKVLGVLFRAGLPSSKGGSLRYIFSIV